MKFRHNPSFHRTLRIKPRKAVEFKRYAALASAAALVIGRLAVRVARHAADPFRAVIADREINAVLRPNREWASFGAAISSVEVLRHFLFGHGVGFNVGPRFAVFFQRLVQHRLPVIHLLFPFFVVTAPHNTALVRTCAKSRAVRTAKR